MDVLNEKWCGRFLNLAKTVSKWSKDESTKVGAIIVSEDGDPISFGFNGFPRGVLELPERNTRPSKYDFSEHAERNAIYLARRDLRGSIMYVTCFPCPDCARAIVQSGISTLVVDKDYHSEIGEGSSIHLENFEQKKINSTSILTEGCVNVVNNFKATVVD